jgi:hypothetical protein
MRIRRHNSDFCRHSFGSAWRLGRARPGFSMLELQVAFVLLGIALAGLGPLVVMQSRQLKRFESRLSPRSAYYIQPPSDMWMRKLGAAATVLPQDPGTTPLVIQPLPANDVQIQSLQKSLTSDSAIVYVSVKKNTP